MSSQNASARKHLPCFFPVEHQRINQGLEINYWDVRWSQKQLCFCCAAVCEDTANNIKPSQERKNRLNFSDPWLNSH